MQLAELIVASGLSDEDGIRKAAQYQKNTDGNVVQSLIDSGAVEDGRLRELMERLPSEPRTVEQTGLTPTFLLELMLKTFYVRKSETASDLRSLLELNYSIVNGLLDEATERRFLEVLGTTGEKLSGQFRYALTREGRQFALDVLERNSYVGPAPVPIEEYSRMVQRQSVQKNKVDEAQIQEAAKGLVLQPGLFRKIGPAVNAAQSILLYGAPGNGKTTIAGRLGSIYDDYILIPAAVTVGSEIIRLFDPIVHHPISALNPDVADELDTGLEGDQLDHRWIAIERPFVVAAGELTLEMLDLQYDNAAGYYDAPLHMKALNGVMLIDDFGRQLVAPKDLLNRWILPLENRIDYLKLHTGKSFDFIFDAIVIFSTNLRPMDLMDAAFLRRIPYKIHMVSPTRTEFIQILQDECRAENLAIGDEMCDLIFDRITETKFVEVAAYQPRFIVRQIVSECKFLGIKPEMRREFVIDALDNLAVEDTE